MMVVDGNMACGDRAIQLGFPMLIIVCLCEGSIQAYVECTCDRLAKGQRSLVWQTVATLVIDFDLVGTTDVFASCYGL